MRVILLITFLLLGWGREVFADKIWIKHLNFTGRNCVITNGQIINWTAQTNVDWPAPGAWFFPWYVIPPGEMQMVIERKLITNSVARYGIHTNGVNGGLFSGVLGNALCFNTNKTNFVFVWQQVDSGSGVPAVLVTTERDRENLTQGDISILEPKFLKFDQDTFWRVFRWVFAAGGFILLLKWLRQHTVGGNPEL